MAMMFEGTIDKLAEDKNLTFLTKADSIEELAEKVDLPDLRKKLNSKILLLKMVKMLHLKSQVIICKVLKRDHFMPLS